MGKTVSELADEYFLSVDSIKKIVYGKKENLIAFEPTISCALQYSETGLAEEWIRAFYVSGEHDIMELPQQYMCFGITKMPLRLICNAADNVERTEERETIEDVPLLVRYMQGRFYLLGQQDLFQIQKMRKINAYPVFILITDKGEYQTFMKYFVKHFQPVRI